MCALVYVCVYMCIKINKTLSKKGFNFEQNTLINDHFFEEFLIITYSPKKKIT